MVGKLLVRGMLAGIAAGLLTFCVAKIAGEPQVDVAIAFEAKADQAKGEAPDPEIVSRETQSGFGLFTGVMVYSTAIGGLFSLVYAYAYGRAGRIGARALAVWLAAAAYIAIVIVPALKYPPNPPAIGDPQTIGMRTGLYFTMIAVSIAAMIFSLSVRRHLIARLGGWNASIVAGLVYLAIIIAVELALPVINEVPGDFPASTLWRFRVVSVGMQLTMWTTIALVFGAAMERLDRARTGVSERTNRLNHA
ncbi:putative cobalt transporter subunit (CbtA) [Pararobbsia alpina]|jgi:hypothetical protein|uniref:CbtA family protein n=1 Tax=Pararobbsia alpina TaxID=621374 RepID=UPI0039A42C2F